jgi:hypothetical protein
VPESAWHKHSPFAFWLLSRLNPQLIVELGVHHGFSFFVFCEYAAKKKGKMQCYAVDLWQGDEHAGYFDASVYENFLHHQAKYKKISHIVKSSFDDAVNNFEDNSIGLLHIDGRHYYEDVSDTFGKWERKIKKDGIVLFHDTRVFEKGFGVHQFWGELSKKFACTFEFLHGHGLGVLCYGNGDTLPPVMKRFFQVPEDKGKEIKDIYCVLGNQVHYEYLLDTYHIDHVKE